MRSLELMQREDVGSLPVVEENGVGYRSFGRVRSFRNRAGSTCACTAGVSVDLGGSCCPVAPASAQRPEELTRP
jgi:hypothetical protein